MKITNLSKDECLRLARYMMKEQVGAERYYNEHPAI